MQPLGGVRAALRVAEAHGLPCVVSSALESSVGIAAGVALAAALPELPFACGLATVALFTDDVTQHAAAAGRRRPAGPAPGARPRSTRSRPTPRPRRGWARPARRGDRRVNPATAFARVLVDELVRGGVTDAVLAPGSRSAPVALALAAAERDGRLRLHVRIDERTAAFLALGLAKASGRPVPVLTTSGTAAAHLHAAVLEADAQRGAAARPDRRPARRSCGAPARTRRSTSPGSTAGRCAGRPTSACPRRAARRRRTATGGRWSPGR